MLSLANPFTAFPVRTPHTSRNTQVHSFVVGPIRCSSKENGTTISSNEENPSPPVPQPITPPDTVERRFRRASRRRRKQQLDGTSEKVIMNSNLSTPNKWESMSLSEKAMELYMGEKGLLFWLNKFAYASIFIMIGGWIAFRFVGPWLNLYQLDTPPLPPTALFKGS